MAKSQQFDIGVVFTESFKLWAANIVQFVGMTLVVGAPIVGMIIGAIVMLDVNLMWMYDPMEPPPQDFDETSLAPFAISMLVISVLAIIGIQLLTVAIVRAASLAFLDKPWDIGTVFGQSTRFVLPAIASGILIGLASAAGVITCCIATVFFIVVWYVTVPAIVVENLGPIEAMRRSWRLVMPNFWYVLLMMFGLAAVNMAVGFVVAIIGLIDPILKLAGDMLSNAFLLSLAPVTQTVMSHHLRRAKEGPAVDGVAEVFE